MNDSSDDHEKKDPDSPSQPFVVTLPDDPGSGGEWYLWAGVLALLALVAFWPSVTGSFLWDDDHMLLPVQAWWHIWFGKIQTIQYYPLTYTMLWIEHHLWGDAPLGYRVVNLLLHAGAAVVLWRVLRRLSVPAAWVAAAAWAVHPLQVESVCWISEGKNVLSGLLGLASILFYLDFAGLRDPNSQARLWRLPGPGQTYAVSLGLFVLAVLAKTVVCCVPPALLVILWWKRRLNYRTLLGLAPMFVIGAALAAVTSRFETDPQGMVQAFGPEWTLDFAQRLLVAGRAFWFYVGKLLLPIHQSFNYPRVMPNPADPGQWIELIAAAALLVVLALGVKKIGRGPLAAVLCYVAALFPSMGFFNVYPFRYSFVADHFQYLAGISLIALAVTIVAQWIGTSPPLWRAGVAAALLLMLGVTSWSRAQVFVASTTLWEDVLQPDKNPGSWLAAYNLGVARESQAAEQFDEADKDFRGGDKDSAQEAATAAVARLEDADALMRRVIDNPAAPKEMLGNAHLQLAKDDIIRLRSPLGNHQAEFADAQKQTELALEFEKRHDELHPDPDPYLIMGEVKRRQAESPPDGIDFLPQTRPSATTRPSTAAEQRLIDLLQQAVDYDRQAMSVAVREAKSEAVEQEAVRLYGLAAYQRGQADWELAEISLQRGDQAAEDEYDRDAIASYLTALRIDPRNVTAHYRVALCLEHFRQWEPAKDHLLAIVANLDHYNAASYNELGRVILRSGTTSLREYEAALQCFRDALNLDPNLSDARKNLEMASKMMPTTKPATQPTTKPAP